MSRAGVFHWHIEKLSSRKDGEGSRSLLRVIEMDGASQTGHYGVYAYEQREKPNYAGVPRHRIFTMMAADRNRVRRLKLVEGSRVEGREMPDTVTLQHYPPVLFASVDTKRFALVVESLTKLEALACRVAGSFINNDKLFLVRQPDQVIDRPERKVFTAELLQAFLPCLYQVAAYQKTVSPHQTVMQFLKLLPHYNEAGGLDNFSFDIDFDALKTAECVPQERVLSAVYARLAQQLVKYSEEMTVERYLSPDKKTDAQEATIECHAIRAMHTVLMSGRNPVKAGMPHELNVFYRHQRLKRSVLLSCQHLLEYLSDFLLELEQLGDPDKSMSAFYGFFKNILPAEVMKKALRQEMQGLTSAMCRLLARRDRPTDDVIMAANSCRFIPPDLPEIDEVKQELKALQYSLNEIQIAMKMRDAFQPTAPTDYFYLELRGRLIALVEPWQRIDPGLAGYIKKHNVFCNPFEPASGLIKPPVVTREEATRTAAAALPVFPAVSASPALLSTSPAPLGNTLQASRTASQPLHVIVEMPGFPAVSATSTPPPPLILDSGGVDDEDEEEVSSTRATPGSTPGSMK
ncbi:MAG: hypothetical protein P1U40_10445 [Coxiellaceae bacterium]|nr:hypothetical protein [Coxiellaceae bacterium]